MEKSALHDLQVAAAHLLQTVRRHTRDQDPVIRVELDKDVFHDLEYAVKVSPEARDRVPHKGQPGKMIMNGVQFVSADLRRERLIG